MKKGAGSTNKNKKVLHICRSINNRVDDVEKLQTLVVKLQDVLREVRYETQVIQMTAQSTEDDPFDKIMVA